MICIAEIWSKQMKVRIYTIDPTGDEETFCITVKDRSDLRREQSILRSQGYQIVATRVLQINR
jgi:hypothetical protein